MMINNILAIILLAVLVAVLLRAFLSFDRLVKLEYAKYKDAWTRDGGPSGFFWHAPENGWLGGHLAKNKLAFYWLFHTPAWASNEPEAAAYFRSLRVSILIWNVALVCFFILMG